MHPLLRNYLLYHYLFADPAGQTLTTIYLNNNSLSMRVKFHIKENTSDETEELRRRPQEQRTRQQHERWRRLDFETRLHLDSNSSSSFSFPSSTRGLTFAGHFTLRFEKSNSNSRTHVAKRESESQEFGKCRAP